MAFKTSKMDQIALEYWYNSFLGHLRVDGRWFFHQNQILKKGSPDQKSRCRMCVSQSLKFPTPKTITGMGTRFRCNDLWDPLDGKSVTYDWLMVALNTIDQSSLTLVHPNDPRNPRTQSLYPFSLDFLKWGIPWVHYKGPACEISWMK